MFSLKSLKSLIQNPKFHSPISHIHNPASKTPSLCNPAIQFVLDEVQESRSSSSVRNDDRDILPEKVPKVSSTNQISHPWSEWVGLMKRLLKDGYFDEIGNPFVSNRGLSNRETNSIRTASLNFARDQHQLIRYLSSKYIAVIAGSGCPTTDRKVVNSGKRLRAHVGINEGNVCSSCILRGDCDRAYVKAREDEGGRTVDVMRFLLTYGLDAIVESVENKPCLNKSVRSSVRALLTEMVDIRVEAEHDCEPPEALTREYTTLTQENDVHQDRGHRAQGDVPLKQGDWICSKCNFLNFARNIKCLRCGVFSEERLTKFAEEQENLPLKKGDWLCDKCNFLNFARNTRCLQCKEKPPKRKINPGEWECDSCNYINFRRNMVCLKCDHKRPIASNTADITSQPMGDSLRSHQTRPWFGPERKQRRHEVDDSLEFVKTFPVVGGKSDMSRDVQMQELWKMKMVGKRENVREDILGYDDKEDDDDDDMAEWFEGFTTCHQGIGAGNSNRHGTTPHLR